MHSCVILPIIDLTKNKVVTISYIETLVSKSNASQYKLDNQTKVCEPKR